MLHEIVYDLRPVKVPRLRGGALRLLVALLENPVTACLIAPMVIRNLGVLDLRAADIKDPPRFSPYTRPQTIP